MAQIKGLILKGFTFRRRNKSRRLNFIKAGLTFFIFLFIFSWPPDRLWSESQDNLETALRQFQEAIENIDYAAYGAVFLSAVSEAEVSQFEAYFSELNMDRVVVYRLPVIKDMEGKKIVFFHVLFQNAHSALIETWRLSWVVAEGVWKVASREVPTRWRNLYRLRIPSSRIERVERVIIEHQDIRLRFQNALVFYDNLPELETALLIIGSGRVFFEPSEANEKHQLKLMYKAESLEADIDHAYLRFSPSFFSRHVQLEGASDSPFVSAKDMDLAARLFSYYQDHFFTVENSLTRELLTAIPQGEEAVFEFNSSRFGPLTYIFSPFAEDEITLYDRRRDRFICLYSPGKSEAGRSLRFSFAPSFDVLHYDLEVEVDPNNFYFSAKAKVRLQPQVASLESLRFRLNPKLNLIRILDGEGRELMFNQDRGSKLVYVPLIEPVGPEPLTLEFFYQGRLEPPPSHTDVLAANQAEETRIVVPMKFESWLYSYSGLWYPSSPTEDYFTARLKLIAPADMTCLGQGVLVETGAIAGRKLEKNQERRDRAFWVYESQVPLKYLAFLVGRMERLQELRTSSGLLLELFSSQEFRLNWKGHLEQADSILSFYERLFGPYPYEEMRVVLRFWETKGGHSPGALVILNQLPRSLSSQGIGSVNPLSPVDLSKWNEYFLAHEIAHQWWGQAVTWRRYRDQWLSEGLAQFATILYLKEKYGPKAYTDILRQFSQWTEKKARWGPIIMGSRLSYLDFEAFQTIIYNKTSLALNLLCQLLGEEVFFKGLREFSRAYRFRPASTADFFRIMEKVSSTDLKAFVQSWFERYSLPHIRVQTSLESEANRSRLKVKVEQAGEVFVFPLTLEWKEGTSLRREKIIIKEKVQEFSFLVAAKPQNFKVNADAAVPGQLD